MHSYQLLVTPILSALQDPPKHSGHSTPSSGTTQISPLTASIGVAFAIAEQPGSVWIGQQVMVTTVVTTFHLIPGNNPLV